MASKAGKADRMSMLEEIWEKQRKYNDKLTELCPDRDNPTRWTEILVLGLINELDEVLREIKWKRHRGSPGNAEVSKQNLAYEFSDLTKYVLSLWQVWGFELNDMLLETYRKSSIMDLRLQQEFRELPPAGTDVLLVDLDGTLADLRGGLWSYTILNCALPGVTVPKVETLNADVDLKIDYRKFQRIKEMFTEDGMFGRLPPLGAACGAVRKALEQGVYVIACTARPAQKHPRLWLETWSWLEDQGLGAIKQLYIGDDARIKILLDLAEQGCNVVLFDDDPNTIERALNSGIKAVVAKYPYNAHLWKRSGVYPVDARHGRVAEAFAKAGLACKSTPAGGALLG